MHVIGYNFSSPFSISSPLLWPIHEEYCIWTFRVDNDGVNKTEITLDSTKLTELSFRRCLEFLYTGYVDLKKVSESLEDTLTAARLFNLPELQLIVENAQKEEEFLNPSIGTWLNDRNSTVAKQLFLNKVGVIPFALYL